jgi:hypothetical protein
MRTTLTLAEDVVAQLQHIQQHRRARFKDVVNDALRAGLRQMATPRERRETFVTGSADLGRCLLGSVDDVSEALAVAEGDGFR